MKKWLLKHAFWLLAATCLGLSCYTISKDAFFITLVLFVMFVFSLIVGVYYLNVEFTKDLLTEYDNLVRVQVNRKGLKVIKGGKQNEKVNSDKPVRK